MTKATSRSAHRLLFLDVNVLLALAWPNHQFHTAATARLEQVGGKWATCAVTELGFIRLSSTPSVVGVSKSPLEVARLLQALLSDPRHVFLERLESPVHPLMFKGFERIIGARQVTDVYLLSLARRHDARFLTFDSRLIAVAGQSEAIELLTA